MNLKHCIHKITCQTSIEMNSFNYFNMPKNLIKYKEKLYMYDKLFLLLIP